MRPILAVIPSLAPNLVAPILVALLLASAAFTFASLRKVAPDEKTSVLSTAAVTTVTLIVLTVMWSRHAITLHSYGLFLILGFAAATYSACLEARRRGLDANAILDVALPLLVGSIIACRLLYVALNHNQFHSFGEVLRVWDGGLSFHGSLVAAPLVVWYFARRNRLSFGAFSDIIAPSVFLGYAIGRVGCLFNGCCYGVPTNLPWAMRFPSETNRSVLTPPCHPTQLYSTIVALLLFAFMQKAKLSPRFTRFPGQLTLLFFALYALERAFVEYFRNGATARPMWLQTPWLTQAQFASFLALIAIAAVWIALDTRARVSPRQAAQQPPL